MKKRIVRLILIGGMITTPVIHTAQRRQPQNQVAKLHAPSIPWLFYGKLALTCLPDVANNILARRGSALYQAGGGGSRDVVRASSWPTALACKNIRSAKERLHEALKRIGPAATTPAPAASVDELEAAVYTAQQELITQIPLLTDQYSQELLAVLKSTPDLPAKLNIFPSSSVKALITKLETSRSSCNVDTLLTTINEFVNDPSFERNMPPGFTAVHDRLQALQEEIRLHLGCDTAVPVAAHAGARSQ